MKPSTVSHCVARWLRLALSMSLVASTACNRSPAPPRAPEAAAVPAIVPTLAPHPPAIREGGFAAALEDARRAHQLVILDFWASWCPPCMSMRASTFTDRALYPLADNFTWVSVDRDTEEGDALAKRLGVHGIPAIFVFDPDVSIPGRGGTTPRFRAPSLRTFSARSPRLRRSTGSPRFSPQRSFPVTTSGSPTPTARSSGA